MKTVNCPFDWGNIIVFSDFLYDYEYGFCYNIPYSQYIKAVKNIKIIYYKINYKIPGLKSISQIIDAVKENDILFSITDENIDLVDMDMEEHDLYLQLNGYERYSND